MENENYPREKDAPNRWIWIFPNIFLQKKKGTVSNLPLAPTPIHLVHVDVLAILILDTHLSGPSLKTQASQVIWSMRNFRSYLIQVKNKHRWWFARNQRLKENRDPNRTFGRCCSYVSVPSQGPRAMAILAPARPSGQNGALLRKLGCLQT